MSHKLTSLNYSLFFISNLVINRLIHLTSLMRDLVTSAVVTPLHDSQAVDREQVLFLLQVGEVHSARKGLRWEGGLQWSGGRVNLRHKVWSQLHLPL